MSGPHSAPWGGKSGAPAQHQASGLGTHPRSGGGTEGAAGRGMARRKTPWLKVPGGSLERPAQVIVGVSVAAWKARTAESKDGLELVGGHTAAQQFFGDPQVGNAPIGLGETLGDAQPVQPTGIDADGPRRGEGRGLAFGVGARRGQAVERLGREPALGCLHQRGALTGQARLGMEEFHPRTVAAELAPGGLLIGEPSQSSQMAPICAGQVSPIGTGQLFAHLGGDGGFQRGFTDAQPGLEMAGAGVEQDAGLMPVGAQGGKDLRVGVIQIQQNVAGVSVPGVGLDVDVIALAVAQAQQSDHEAVGELDSGPQLRSWEWASCAVVNQTKPVEVAGHRRQLSANRLQGDEKSVVHDGTRIKVWTNGRE